ncbi:MAG: type II secretion system protein GspF [Bdellovibrionales bacterium RIFCSPHIGHO2_01_FULL_40_29]|nr:MAG: type II secretion system protein GspF [Bdellovibrionales bacterium RIFCSPHIGHO2_01_FULL_40_29]OFZ34539.1 MAG: type II secretion system protein GspF [Bdellovibrionales bacterium RIFCSPHIGHO2_02_FULL_40_15]
MPIFEYKGLTRDGNNTKGVIDSENLRTARMKLKKDGIFVVAIADKKKSTAQKKSSARGRSGSVPVKDLSLMTRQLATLIKANVPLVEALTAVSEQVENPILSEALADCKNMVNEGLSLHKAFAKYPAVFSPIFLSMAEAGEMSGTLDVILIRLAEFTESQAELRQRIQSAMTYPIIMLVVITLVIFGLFTKVLPEILAVFESFPDMTLPWYTQAISATSQVFINNWYFFAGFIVISILLFTNWKNSTEGRKSWDAISLKLPLAGEIIRMVAISRFTRTLATLLNGGVPMLNALDIVRNVVDNHVIALAIDEAKSNISEGESIAGPLKKSGHFPPLVVHMVNIGEKTGDLENMLTLVADAYDFQVKSKVDTITTILNPFMTLLIGIVIFVIVLSIIVPMFDLTSKLGG